MANVENIHKEISLRVNIKKSSLIQLLLRNPVFSFLPLSFYLSVLSVCLSVSLSLGVSMSPGHSPSLSIGEPENPK